MYKKIKNLGRESNSKIEFVELAHSFPDFFIKQNGKNSQNFHFGRKKRVKNGKNSQSFHFEKKKRVQNRKNRQNFHFGKKNRV